MCFLLSTFDKQQQLLSLEAVDENSIYPIYSIYIPLHDRFAHAASTSTESGDVHVRISINRTKWKVSSIGAIRI